VPDTLLPLLGALLAAGLGVAAALDRLLAAAVARGRIRRPEIRLALEVDAPLERVWALASDIARQPEWMHEMKRVEMLTPPPVGVGSRGRATVRIFGISTTDEVVITRYEPPVAFGIRHEGRFTGEGLLEFRAIGASRTRIDWMEFLRPPLFGTLGAYLQRPILGAIFSADLRSLARLLRDDGGRRA